MPPHTILFIHHANDMYGADFGLLNALQSLDLRRFYPVVILPSDMPKGMLTVELDRRGVEYHFAPLGILRRKYFSLRAIIPHAVEFLRGVAYVRRAARHHDVALVYVNTIVAVSGAIGGRLAGIPVLWCVREILFAPSPVRWALYRALGLCADSIVCMSRAIRDSLLKEAPNLSAKTVVIYDAMSVRESRRTGHEIGFRQELGIPQDAPLVGMVGRISHWKGQEILVEAAGLVLRNHPDAHFVAVGSYFADESHYLRKLQSLIHNLGLNGRFHLVDYRTNVTDVYRALDIFVLPSRKPEPFGLVTVEAMKQGRAVIATNHGGSCELIQDGVTGVLVPHSDPKALETAIDLLLTDQGLREEIGRAAAIYAETHFSPALHAERLRSLINQLTKEMVAPKPTPGWRRSA
jgi:glycosyltransferase involved in cell wall biosynthesis